MFSFKKILFIFAHNDNLKITIYKKKEESFWEIPCISLTDSQTIIEPIEKILKDNLTIFKYKILGVTDSLNKYELPKEFQTITGYSGEEHKFAFVQIYSEPKNELYYEIKQIYLDEIPDYVRIRDFNKIKEKLREEFLRKTNTISTSEDKNNKNIIGNEIDRLF